MIKYKLICNNCLLTFDSWFASSLEYEKLKKKKYLSCHSCSSFRVEKTLMAPMILSAKSHSLKKIDIKKINKIKKTIDEYQKFIESNFKYVGKNFAYEARSIHYKYKKTSKGIYGIATKEDLKELKEEGIEAEKIPWLKNTTN